jgi:fructokinase
MPGDHIEDSHPIWAAVVHDLGELLASLILAVSPERIALGGGIACARPWLADRARRAVINSLGGYLEDMPRDIDTMIDIATLGNRAGPLGAVAVGMTAQDKWRLNSRVGA